MSTTITTTVSATSLTVAGNTGIPTVLPVVLDIGAASVTVTTDATGAWTYTETPPTPGTYTIVATCQSPAVPLPPVVATTTAVIAYPPGLTLPAPPTVVGTLLSPGTPAIEGNYIVLPFTGNWVSTAELVTFAVDGNGTSTGWKNPGTTGNTFSIPTSGLAAGLHAAEISTGTPAMASITWDFIYEQPATNATTVGSSGSSSTTPPDTLITRPAFPLPNATGELGAVMQRANDTATAATITTCLVTFKQGTLPTGSSVMLGGAPAQLDVHTTWSDKSVRVASLTANAPALAADASVMPMLATAPVMTGTPPSLTLPAGAVTIDLEIGGTAYSYDVATLLAGVQPDWLNGPLAVQGRISQVVTGYLRLLIDVCCHADGSWNVVVGFNGDLAFEATSPAAVFTEMGHIVYENLTYGWQDLVLQSVIVRQAGVIVKQVTNLTQYQYTVWHVEVDSRSAVPEMLFDVQAHIDSGLMPRFNLAGVSNVTIASYCGGISTTNGFCIPCTPPATAATGYYPNPVPTLGWGGLTTYMGETGGRNDIGMATDASCAWAITYDPRMRAYCLAQAEGAASIPWHAFVRANNRYINTDDQPKLWTSSQALQQGNTTGLPADQQLCGSNWQLDAAHMPNACMIPYLLTGRRHYLDEMLAQAAWCVMNINARGYTIPYPIVGFGQYREMAWCMRAVGCAMLLAEDTNPLLPWLTKVVAGNLSLVLGINASAQGELAAYWYNGTDLLAPWQVDFQVMPIVMLADCGVANAIEVLTVMAGFVCGRFIAQTGWFPSNGFGYYYTVPATTWPQIQTTLIAGNASVPDATIAFPPDSNDQYVAGAFQAVTQINRIVGSATTAAALAFVTTATTALGAGEVFTQSIPSFAITQ